MKRRIAINTIFGIMARCIYIVITLFLNKIFLIKLGLDYLGLNATFNEVMGILSFAEMGIGVAISYELYKPLAENNYNQVNRLLSFYRSVYNIIALVIVGVGTILAIVVSASANTNINRIEVFICFLLFVFNNAFSYIIADRRTLIEACQDGYILNIVDTIIQLFFIVIKCLVLYFFSSYYLFLLFSIIQTVSSVIIIWYISNKKYTWLNSKAGKLDRKEIKSLFKIISSRIVMKFSNIAVNSTDNLIVSMMINVATVGLFYNYKIIFSNVMLLASQFFSALTPALGMTLVDKNISDESNLIYIKKSEFISTCISIFCGVSLVVLSSPFIDIIYGNEYVITSSTVILFAISFYIDINREIHWKVNHVRAGYSKQRLFFYGLRAILNLVISIIGCYVWKLNGVIFGTIISGSVIWVYESWLMYKKVFKINYSIYVKRQIKGAISFMVIMLFTVFATSKSYFVSKYINFLFYIVIDLLITILGICVTYNKEIKELYKFMRSNVK